MMSCENILIKNQNKKYNALNSNITYSNTLSFFRVVDKIYKNVNFAFDLFNNNTNMDFGKKLLFIHSICVGMRLKNLIQ